MNITNMTVKELKRYCRYYKIRGFSNKNKKQLIEYINNFQTNINETLSQMNQSLNIDGRHTAKKDEDIRLDWIVDLINNKTEKGTEMCQDYFRIFGKEILRVEKKGSNSDHYDLVMHHTDGTTKKCEEKGSKTYRKIINSLDIPWKNSVQRFNGIGNKFTIGIKWATLWYDIIVANHNTSNLYGIDTSLIPNKDEWLQRDAFVCHDPETEWGRLLKKNHREMYPVLTGSGTSMNGKKGVPVDSREEVNSQFIFTENDKHILLKETQIILDEIMNEKECWFQTSGTIDGPFNWQWHDKIESPKIKDIEMTWSKGADIYFHFIAENAKYNFKCILRFGKGTGFSNIRFDIR